MTIHIGTSRLRADLEGPVFVLIGLGLGAIMIGAGQTVYAVQGTVAIFASLLPFGYAFAAGMVATVNPCGVLLLPSLAAYYLQRDDARAEATWRRTGRALLLGVMATLGFVSVFTVVGIIIATGGRALANAFPLGGLLVGIALAAMGVWLALTGKGFGILAASRALETIRLRDDVRSLFGFGVAYAITSLSCTLPIFLVVAGSAIAAADPVTAVGRFVGYALGMGTVLTAVILGVAFFQRAVGFGVHKAVPYVHRLAASFLLGAGLFVANYWLTAGYLLRLVEFKP